MENNNRNANHTNVILNLFQDLNKGIRKKGQGNKFVTEDIIHVITSHNVEQEVQKSVQSDVVIPNKLSNGDTCYGLRHWRLLFNLKNNLSKPVRNDMDNNNKLDCFAFARNDMILKFGDNKILNQAQDDNAVVAQNNVINKSIKNLFPYFPLSFTLKKKIDSSHSLRMTAFTLAEVLITLGIIGIVAAMTIPTLISNYQKKQTVTKLQKAISVFNQAYKMSFDDLGDPGLQGAFDLNATKYINTYLAPYLKITNICETYSECGYDSMSPITNLQGKKIKTYIIMSPSRIGIQTIDGFTYVIYTASWDETAGAYTKASDTILVDLNGSSKPNQMGKDIFMLKRVENKGVIPDCYNSSNEVINRGCSETTDGYCCAEKIKRAGWNIDKSYPWK